MELDSGKQRVRIPRAFKILCVLAAAFLLVSAIAHQTDVVVLASNLRSSSAPDLVARTLADLARTTPIPRRPYKLVGCTMTKNEGRYIQGWVLYHYLLGFDHFIILHDNSTDNTRSQLAPLEAAGLVTVYEQNDPRPLVVKEGEMRRKCTDGSIIPRSEFEWLSMHDVDEYISTAWRPSLDSLRPTQLTKWLDQRTAARQSVVVMTHLTFGTSGHVDPPVFPMLEPEHYTERRISPGAISRTTTKILARLEGTPDRLLNAHWDDPLEGWQRTTVGLQPAQDKSAATALEPFFLAHMLTRSLSECVGKAQDAANAGSWRKQLHVDEICSANHLGSPNYDQSVWTEDHRLRISPLTLAARQLRFDGGILGTRAV